MFFCRFVDNFSAGTRGAASTEYFIKKGYAVILLHRDKSVEPLARHLDSKLFLDLLKEGEDGNLFLPASAQEKVIYFNLKIISFRMYYCLHFQQNIST